MDVDIVNRRTSKTGLKEKYKDLTTFEVIRL